jgi:hypothetical protein
MKPCNRPNLFHFAACATAMICGYLVDLQRLAPLLGSQCGALAGLPSMIDQHLAYTPNMLKAMAIAALGVITVELVRADGPRSCLLARILVCDASMMLGMIIMEISGSHLSALAGGRPLVTGALMLIGMYLGFAASCRLLRRNAE